jgi:uncharacterized protein (TIGR02611 family)
VEQVLTISEQAFVRHERTRLQRFFLIVMGWTFLVVGVAGLLLPILPGWLFIFAGLLVLSTEYVWAHKLVQRARVRFPKLAASLDSRAHRLQAWVRRYFSTHKN